MKKQVITLQQLQEKPSLKTVTKNQAKHIKGGSDGVIEEETVGG